MTCVFCGSNNHAVITGAGVQIQACDEADDWIVDEFEIDVRF